VCVPTLDARPLSNLRYPSCVDAVRAQAEAFKCALEIGAASVDDVVGWARALILDVDHPHWSLCELALSSKKYAPDLTPILEAVPGRAEASHVRKLVLHMLLDPPGAPRTRGPSRALAVRLGDLRRRTRVGIERPGLVGVGCARPGRRRPHPGNTRASHPANVAKARQRSAGNLIPKRRERWPTIACNCRAPRLAFCSGRSALRAGNRASSFRCLPREPARLLTSPHPVSFSLGARS